jgi:hypothetical protein
MPEILLLFDFGQRNIIGTQGNKPSSLKASLLESQRQAARATRGASVRRWLLGKGSARRLAATED